MAFLRQVYLYLPAHADQGCGPVLRLVRLQPFPGRPGSRRAGSQAWWRMVNKACTAGRVWPWVRVMEPQPSPEANLGYSNPSPHLLGGLEVRAGPLVRMG